MSKQSILLDDKPLANTDIPPTCLDLKAAPTRAAAVKKWESAAAGAKLLIYWVDYKEWRGAEVVFQWQANEKLWIHVKFQATSDEQLDLARPDTFNRVIVVSTTRA